MRTKTHDQTALHLPPRRNQVHRSGRSRTADPHLQRIRSCLQQHRRLRRHHRPRRLCRLPRRCQSRPAAVAVHAQPARRVADHGRRHDARRRLARPVRRRRRPARHWSAGRDSARDRARHPHAHDPAAGNRWALDRLHRQEVRAAQQAGRPATETDADRPHRNLAGDFSGQPQCPDFRAQEPAGNRHHHRD